MPDLPTDGKYRASPAYVQADDKPKEAAEVKWRPKPTVDVPQPEWSALPGAPDSVVADTWWTAVWELNGEGERAREVEIGYFNAEGGWLRTDERTLTWAIAAAGERNYLIHMGQRMLIGGPRVAPPYPAQELRLRLTTDFAPEPAGAATRTVTTLDYRSDGPTYRDMEFVNEGHYTITAEPLLIATGQPLGAPATTRVHVIKKREIEAVAYWWGDARPTANWQWLLIGGQMLFSQAGWQHVVPSSSARWVLYKNPTRESWSSWAQYTIADGEKANPPAFDPFDFETWLPALFVTDRPLLWWGPKIGLGWNKACFYAKYNDGISPEPLVLEWDEGDQRAARALFHVRRHISPGIYLTTSDGFQTAFTDGMAFYGFLVGVPHGKITRFEAFGHGSLMLQQFGPQAGDSAIGNPPWLYGMSGTRRILLHLQANLQLDITAALQERISPSAYITLCGCHTADYDEDDPEDVENGGSCIARLMSEILPGRKVYGQIDKGLYRKYWNRKDEFFEGKFRTFFNGVRVESKSADGWTVPPGFAVEYE